jgi:RNA polymerase sigma factor (sigma-70 family)
LQSVVSVEDLLQETFAQAFRDIGRFDPHSERSLPAWLDSIAENRLHDAIRRHRRKKRGGSRRAVRAADPRRSSLVELAAVLAANGDSPSERAASEEAVRAVQVALASLPED